MTQYRRNHSTFGMYFFTVNILDRKSDLLTKHIEVLKKSIRKEQNRAPFSIQALVVLPDHLHTIWQLPEGDLDYSARWKRIKMTFSSFLEPTETRSLSRVKKNERGIWQRRFWEHTIRDEADFKKHFDYIHYNPIKHNLVKNLHDWPYSTFHAYVKKGIYPFDWFGVIDKNLENKFD